MSEKLGNLLGMMETETSWFSKRPNQLEVYENGLIAKYKNESKEYLFEELASVMTSNYFAPNLVNYHFDIADRKGDKISLAIPYENREGATLLLKSHAKYQLGSEFPKDLPESTFVLDDHYTWEKGKLIYNGGKGIEEYLPEQIDQFVEKDGSYFFTLKNSKETLLISIYDSPNCLTTIWVCQEIAELN